MELVAPARDLDTLKAAFDAGADAVYLGLKEFSARKRAKNFTFEELLTAYAIKAALKKRIYVAINTLIFQDELPRLIEILAFLEAMKTDAIIIQDYGIYELVKTFSINIPLHASTQMGTKNHRQANFLKELGFKRVVLERQLTLQEIEEIKEKTDIELEVFIHGALCFSLSGFCYFSKAFTDRSGNRGDCAQPCRWAYSSKEGTIEYPFSMKDLNGLTLVPKLMKLGITSLKIEGRMKGVDYVFPVVSAYRKLIDRAKGATLDDKSLKEIEKELEASTLSRETERGFFFFKEGDKSRQLLTDERGTGLYIGTVQSVTRTALFFKTLHEFNVGDTLRIDNPKGDERFKIPVKAIYYKNKKVKTASKGTYVGLPSNEPKIKANFAVYLVHRRNSYKPKKVSIKPLPPVDWQPRNRDLKRLYNDYLKSQSHFESALVELNFDVKESIYRIDGERLLFIPPTVYESHLSFYDGISESDFNGLLISHPSEALLFPHLPKYTTFFLPATNIFAINFLKRFNIKALSITPDLSQRHFELIKAFFPRWIRWQNTPLCISRTHIDRGSYRLLSVKEKTISVKNLNGNTYLMQSDKGTK